MIVKWLEKQSKPRIYSPWGPSVLHSQEESQEPFWLDQSRPHEPIPAHRRLGLCDWLSLGHMFHPQSLGVGTSSSEVHGSSNGNWALLRGGIWQGETQCPQQGNCFYKVKRIEGTVDRVNPQTCWGEQCILQRELWEMEHLRGKWGPCRRPCQPLGPGALCEPGSFTVAYTGTTSKFRKWACFLLL